MFNIYSLPVIMFLHTETSKDQVKCGNQGHIVKLRAPLPRRYSYLNSVRCYGQNLDFSSTVGPILPRSNFEYHLHTSDPNLTTAVFFKDAEIVAMPFKTYPLTPTPACVHINCTIKGFFLGLKLNNSSFFVQVQTREKNKLGLTSLFSCNENEIIRFSLKMSLDRKESKRTMNSPN